MDNINSHINVKFYYLLNETIPGSVALELYAKMFFYILKTWENIAFFILELILTTLLNTCIILIVILM